MRGHTPSARSFIRRTRTAALATTVTGLGIWLALRESLSLPLAAMAPLLAALVPGMLLQLPPALRHTRPLPALARALAGALALALVLALLDGAPPAAAATGALTVALVMLGLGAACLLAPRQGREAVHGLLVTGLAALALSPVWLAPWLDAASRVPGLVNALVALNPLTLLASPMALDYLRADWFYRYSPLGSLRYDYPAPAVLMLGWLGAGTGMLLAKAARRRWTSPKNPRLNPEVPR